MWYVWAGLILSVIVVGIMAMGAFKDGGAKLAAWPIFGGILSGGGMLWLYKHAVKAGGGNTAPREQKQSQTLSYGCY